MTEVKAQFMFRVITGLTLALALLTLAIVWRNGEMMRADQRQWREHRARQEMMRYDVEYLKRAVQTQKETP